MSRGKFGGLDDQNIRLNLVIVYEMSQQQLTPVVLSLLSWGRTAAVRPRDNLNRLNLHFEFQLVVVTV